MEIAKEKEVVAILVGLHSSPRQIHLKGGAAAGSAVFAASMQAHKHLWLQTDQMGSIIQDVDPTV